MSNTELIENNSSLPLAEMSTDDLRKEFFKSLDITVKHFIHMANIWKELEQRGEDMSRFREGIAIYIEMIAHNHIDPNLVVRYTGKKVLLNALSKLPMEQQKLIAQDEYVEVARVDGDDISSEKIKLSALPSTDIYTVIGEYGIRPVAEQQRMLIQREGKTQKKQRRARKVEVDPVNNTLNVGGSVADLDKVLNALSKHYGIDISKLKEQADG